MQDNIIAVIVFILAITGLIALVVYKLHKENNNKVTIENFLDIYHINLFNAIQDVVSLLSINVDDFESKEEYERVIISTTIAKLEENCDEFGISSALLKLVDREVLTNILYDILYTNKVQIFFSTLPEKIIKSKPELYDEEVIEAFENSEPMLNEDCDTHTEPQEEPKHEENEVIEQEEAIADASNDEKNKEVEEAECKNDEIDVEVHDNEYSEENTDEGSLPPREAYYGEEKKKYEISAEDVETAELEIVEDIDWSIDWSNEIFSNPNTFTTMPNPIEEVIPTFDEEEPIMNVDSIDELKTLEADVQAALEGSNPEE